MAKDQIMTKKSNWRHSPSARSEVARESVGYEWRSAFVDAEQEARCISFAQQAMERYRKQNAIALKAAADK